MWSYLQSIELSKRSDNNAIPHYKSMLNLAALHHSHGDIAVGIGYYKNSLDTMNTYNHDLYECKHGVSTDPNPNPVFTLDSNSCGQASYVPWDLIAMTQTNLGAAYIQSDQIVEVCFIYIMLYIVYCILHSVLCMLYDAT